MSTYPQFNDDHDSNNNAVLAVFAIVLAALIVIGFMMSYASTHAAPDPNLNSNSSSRFEQSM